MKARSRVNWADMDHDDELLLERMGGERMEINAAWLPLLAPIGRTLAPRAYQRGMRKFAHTH